MSEQPDAGISVGFADAQVKRRAVPDKFHNIPHFFVVWICFIIRIPFGLVPPKKHELALPFLIAKLFHPEALSLVFGLYPVLELLEIIQQKRNAYGS